MSRKGKLARSLEAVTPLLDWMAQREMGLPSGSLKLVRTRRHGRAMHRARRKHAIRVLTQVHGAIYALARINGDRIADHIAFISGNPDRIDNWLRDRFLQGVRADDYIIQANPE